MPGRNIYTVIYVAVSVLCVFISAYLSYWGYYSHLEGLTIFFVAVLALLLFGCDLLVRDYRIKRYSLVLPLLFFVMVACFSMASNFNFLYTNFMKYQMAESAVTRSFEIYRSDLTDTRTRLLQLSATKKANDLRDKVTRELSNLKEQLNDPLRPGCGKRCRFHIKQINQFLGEEPTDLKIPNPDAPKKVYHKWYQNYKNVVKENLRSILHSGPYGKIKDLIHRIDTALQKYDNPKTALDAALQKERFQLISGQGLPILDALRESSRNIQREANAILPDGQHVSHREIRSNLDKIGEIPISFRHGFLQAPNPGVTAVSFVLGAFVDLAPILFALVLFAPGRGSDSTGGDRRGPASRRVAT